MRRGLWAFIRRVGGLHAAPVRPARLAIGAILKDEGPYLLEWIAWHRCLGIRDFFLADNCSSDGTTKLLVALDAAGVVTWIDFPGTPDKSPQVPSYIHIAETFSPTVDWIAFIDGDEFIQPLTPHNEQAHVVQTWLAALPDNVGAVAMNWAIYGSSSRTEPGAGLVVERFTHRAPQNLSENDHMKSIVRTRSWRGATRTPHGFMVHPSTFYIDTKANLVSRHDVERGRMRSVIWGSLRLNHYVVKSRAEFLRKKLPRGRADSLTAAVRTLPFFHEVDRDNIEDAIDPAFVIKVKAEMERLRAALGPLDPAIRDMDLGPILPDEPLLAAVTLP